MSSVSPSLPASVPVFLGVDGGGSHTRAWLIDADGNLHGHGAAGPSNPSNVGTTGAFDAIVSATGLARRQAGVEASDIAAAFVACAGIKTPAEGQALAQLLTTAGLAGQVTVRNDTEVALAGGLGGAPGIALVGGTGSFCFGRNAAGATAHCGGWGWLLDDCGGAFWIGREVVRAVAFASDGRGPATALHAPVLAHFGVASPDDLLGALYLPGHPPESLAELAPLAGQAAIQGDEVAIEILQNSARGAAELVRQVARALDWTGPLPVVTVGGLARSGLPYTPILQLAVAGAVPGVRITEPLLPSVAGAALLALKTAGRPCSEALLRQLQHAARHAPPD